MRSPSRTKAHTVISFLVRVPVLSVQMTVVEPSVSTAGSRRTSARIRAMRCMPIASVIVATAGRPSGTAAMASEMPISSMSRKAWPRRKPATTITAQRASTTPTRAWPSWASFRSRGVSRSPASSIRAPILPISVRAGGRDDQPAAAVGDRRAHEGHVGAVAQRRDGVGDRVGGLGHGERFARQRRLLDQQPRGLGHPAVGGHPRPGRDDDDVPGHQLGRGDLALLARPGSPGPRRRPASGAPSAPAPPATRSGTR